MPRFLTGVQIKEDRHGPPFGEASEDSPGAAARRMHDQTRARPDLGEPAMQRTRPRAGRYAVHLEPCSGERSPEEFPVAEVRGQDQ